MNSRGLIKSARADLTVRDVAGVLFRHKLLICATFFTVAIGSGIVSYVSPNEYESRMRILVKNSRTDVSIAPERTAENARETVKTLYMKGRPNQW